MKNIKKKLTKNTTTQHNIPLISLNDIADITQVNQGFIKIDEELTNHENLKIYNEEGVHGLRYNKDGQIIQGYNDETNEWEDLQALGSGGIELSPTPYIDIKVCSEGIEIRWKDATDVILGNNVFSEWQGTRLIKKENSAPLDENDGEILLNNEEKNKYINAPYIDNNVDNNKVYFYALFPYSKKNIFNTSVSNIRKIIKTGEEVLDDIQNGKAISEINSIALKWSDPEDKENAIWLGTRIVRKIGTPPTNENDGEIIYTSTERNKHILTPYIDTTANLNEVYYYGIFPFSVGGIFNININNVVFNSPSLNKVYSYFIDFSQPDPLNNVEYADDSVEYNSPEEWDQCPLFKKIKPCILKDGKVNYYLNVNNFEETITGERSNLNGEDGDVMIEFPPISYKIESVSDSKCKIFISDDYKLCDNPDWVSEHFNYGEDGANFYSDKFYVSAYVAHVANDKIVSVIGKSKTNKTVGQINTFLKNKYKNMFVTHFYFWQLFVFLIILKYKTTCVLSILNLTNNNTTTVTGSTSNEPLTNINLNDSTPKDFCKMLGIEILSNTTLITGGCLLWQKTFKGSLAGETEIRHVADFRVFITDNKEFITQGQSPEVTPARPLQTYQCYNKTSMAHEKVPVYGEVNGLISKNLLGNTKKIKNSTNGTYSTMFSKFYWHNVLITTTAITFYKYYNIIRFDPKIQQFYFPFSNRITAESDNYIPITNQMVLNGTYYFHFTFLPEIN